jgi:hypothetical protein
MTKPDQSLQLDLTAGVTEAPQANNLALFIRMMEAVDRGQRSLDDLATSLQVELRTIHYYADFGRWLGFLQNTGTGQLAVTAPGQAFAESIPARGRLFASALFAKPLVQTVQNLKREALERDGEELDTLEACLEAIRAMTDLAPSTVERRASALNAMLQWAYKPSTVDWATGEPNERARIPYDFQGQSFLTAMAARQFGTSRTLYVAFPSQVLAIVKGHGEGIQSKHWVRASYDSANPPSTWFGSLPVNPTTLAAVRRGGPDLRRLLVTCSPYVAIVVTMLHLRDPARRPLVHLTEDMYGVQIWYRERMLGQALAVLDEAAAALGLVPTRSIPHLEGRHAHQDRSFGDGADLVELLLTTGIARREDTTISLARGFEDELRHGSEAMPALSERLELIVSVVESWLKNRARTGP